MALPLCEMIRSRLAVCIDASAQFLLSRQEATEIIEQLVDGIHTHWQPVCDEADLIQVDRNAMWNRQFLNPFAFEEMK